MKDLVEVIRCKDCKYFDHEMGNGCSLHDMWNGPNDYCSMGERKEGDNRTQEAIDRMYHIIRCKDCKHHQDEEPGMVYCPNMLGGWIDNNFFCGWAERKESEE